ncbi:MAG: hypothetical protein E4H01_03890 [Lysobacterales bacterium]|nr:MAG: hypothetical protein E4H01_03890 [Xanthomonadales bacterium]
MGAPFYSLLEYFDKVIQQRVGSTGFPNAMDPDAINSKAAFVDKFAEAAMERINLMARILAEGPVKAIFWKIMELEAKHRQKPLMVKLRGKWVQVDPREWRNKFDMTVTVGIGTGSQQTVLNGAMWILNIQQGMGAAGLAGRVVSEQNAFHAGRRYAKAVFPKDADLFFTDPGTLPPPQPKPDPEMIKLQYQDQWKQMGDAQKRDKMGLEAQLKQMQDNWDKEKIALQGMIDAGIKDKSHDADAAKQAMEAANQERQLMLDKLSDISMAVDKNESDKEKIALQGIVDRVLEAQKATNDHIARLHEAAIAEKEIVRDAKGKAQGVRVKKQQ